MRVLTAIRLAGTVLAITATAAAEEAARPLSGEATLGVEYSSRDQDNAKFREYWYDAKSFFGVLPEARLAYESGIWWADLDLNGRSGLQGRSHEGSFAVEGGGLGLFTVEAEYKRVTHTFAYGARTLYSGIGTDTLTLDDGVQQRLQGAATYYGLSTTGMADAIGAEMAGAFRQDLGLRRDRVNASLEWKSLEPLAFGLRVDGEQRRGARPFGVVLGSSPGAAGVVEIAEPIKYQTLNLSAHAEWSDVLPGVRYPAWASVHGGVSSFKNDYLSVRYENPFRFTDSLSGSAAGPAAGQSALAPDNETSSVGAGFGVTLPAHLRLAASGHYAIGTQDAPFLPNTINSLISTPVLPRASLDGRVVRTAFETSLSARPAPRAHSAIRYRYHSHDNETDPIVITEWVVGDTSKSKSATAYWVSSIEREVEFEQAYEIARRTVATLTLAHALATFENGSADREVENTAKLSFDSRMVEWASIRVGGEYAARDSDYPDYSGTTFTGGELPWMRKYYAASRDRSKLVAMLTVYASDELALSGERVEGLDEYPESLFGLQRSRSHLTSVALDYDAADGVQFGAYYSQEEFASTQRGRQWTPRSTSGAAPVADPYDQSWGVENPSNWTVDASDVVRTLGFNSRVPVVAERVWWIMEGSYSSNDGTIGVASPVGIDSGTTATPYDQNAFIPQDWPQVDEARGASLGCSFRCQVTKAVAAMVGYRYDVWKIEGFQYEGYTTVAENTLGRYAGLISMDTLPHNYEVHTVFARVSTVF